MYLIQAIRCPIKVSMKESNPAQKSKHRQASRFAWLAPQHRYPSAASGHGNSPI
ncbi:MAG: hypothetical protein IPO37_25570 [Saprospiraceae bacterium]|nr:hypothetical protein [Saprospiraceae bacterium]